MKYASEDLRNEHEGILVGLKILESMTARMPGAHGGSDPDRAAIVDFFKLFTDKCHHGKEEGLFFPALEKAGVARENGPIGQMLAEHVAGRAHLARMADALKLTAFRPEEFRGGARDYIDLLRAHIEKENTVLFPMGDRLLPAAEQTRLLAAFETYEERVMGAGTHEKLHKILAAFTNKYLSQEGRR